MAPHGPAPRTQHGMAGLPCSARGPRSRLALQVRRDSAWCVRGARRLARRSQQSTSEYPESTTGSAVDARYNAPLAFNAEVYGKILGDALRDVNLHALWRRHWHRGAVGWRATRVVPLLGADGRQERSACGQGQGRGTYARPYAVCTHVGLVGLYQHPAHAAWAAHAAHYAQATTRCASLKCRAPLSVPDGGELRRTRA